jgi:hypothetical protein
MERLAVEGSNVELSAVGCQRVMARLTAVS